MIRKSRGVFDSVLGALGVTLHDKQAEVAKAFFDDQKRFIVVVAGRRSGKTLLSALFVVYALLEKDANIWIVSRTYDLARRVWDYVVPMMEKLTGGRGVKISEATLTLKTEWGSCVECKSADHPQSLLGKGIDLLIIDEAAEIPEKVWQMRLSPTLRDRKGSVVFITTPLGRNYIYHLFIKGQKGEDGFWSLQYPSWVNTYVFDDEEKDLAKRQLDEVSYRGQHEAEFVSSANMVYGCFDRERNVRPIPEDLEGWSISLTVDPGYNGACAMLWIAHNKVAEEDFVIREIVQPKLEFDDVLQLIQKYEPEGGYEALICDVAGKATSQETGRSFVRWMEETEFFRSRKYFWEYNKCNLTEDLNLVRSRIRNAAGEIRFFISPDCYELLYAMENYAYPENATSEVPVKDGRTDHPADAARYYLVWRYRKSYLISVEKR